MLAAKLLHTGGHIPLLDHLVGLRCDTRMTYLFVVQIRSNQRQTSRLCILPTGTTPACNYLHRSANACSFQSARHRCRMLAALVCCQHIYSVYRLASDRANVLSLHRCTAATEPLLTAKPRPLWFDSSASPRNKRSAVEPRPKIRTILQQGRASPVHTAVTAAACKAAAPCTSSVFDLLCASGRTHKPPACH
jgi:hypothetical protein